MTGNSALVRPGRGKGELEIRGVLATQQGTGTFITDKQPEKNELEENMSGRRVVLAAI